MKGRKRWLSALSFTDGFTLGCFSGFMLGFKLGCFGGFMLGFELGFFGGFMLGCELDFFDGFMLGFKLGIFESFVLHWGISGSTLNGTMPVIVLRFSNAAEIHKSCKLLAVPESLLHPVILQGSVVGLSFGDE